MTPRGADTTAAAAARIAIRARGRARVGRGSARSGPSPGARGACGSRRDRAAWRSGATGHRNWDTPEHRWRMPGASKRPRSRRARWTALRPRPDPRPAAAWTRARPGRIRPRARASGPGKPLHSTERAKDVTVQYRWHPLYSQMARVNRSVPFANGELLFCELLDGTRGTLPAWMPTRPRVRA